jgi:hypothetical protein
MERSNNGVHSAIGVVLGQTLPFPGSDEYVSGQLGRHTTGYASDRSAVAGLGPPATEVAEQIQTSDGNVPVV